MWQRNSWLEETEGVASETSRVERFARWRCGVTTRLRRPRARATCHARQSADNFRGQDAHLKAPAAASPPSGYSWKAATCQEKEKKKKKLPPGLVLKFKTDKSPLKVTLPSVFQKHLSLVLPFCLPRKLKLTVTAVILFNHLI